MAAVAATTVGGDQQLRRRRIAQAPHLLPPALHRRDGERRRIVIDADTHPALVGRHIVDAAPYLRTTANRLLPSRAFSTTWRNVDIRRTRFVLTPTTSRIS